MSKLVERGATVAAELFESRVPSADPLRGHDERVRGLMLDAFAHGAMWAFERAQHAIAITHGKYRVEYSHRERGAARVVFLALLGVLAFLLAACGGGGSSDAAAPADPVISCTSAGVCTTFAPGTTAAQIEAQQNPTPAPAPSPAPTLTGSAWTMRTFPNYFYTSESGRCVLRANHSGVCAGVGHHAYVFTVTARSCSGTPDVCVIGVGSWRSEEREWSVVNSVLQPSYTVTRTLTSNGFNTTWRSDRDTWDFEYTNGETAARGNRASLGGTTIGVYGRARRSAPLPHVDLAAPWLHSGVETSLTVDADGSIYGQGADGCVLQGRALDPLTDAWRATLTLSCAPGVTFSGYGGSVDGELLIAAIGGAASLVVVARP